jgi:DNA-binding CsgD family transcriptional regulator
MGEVASIVPVLTDRQTKIVELIAAGCTDKELVRRLGMSSGTLRTHLDRMFRRFGVHSRAALVAVWLRRP